MNAHDHDIIHRLREFLELEPGAAATQHAMERTSYALQNRVADTPEQRLLIMRTRIIMFSQVAACIAALLVIGGMLFWGVPQIVGTSVALGEVLEKMKASRSVTFDAVFKDHVGSSHKVKTTILRSHLRRNVNSDGDIAIYDAKQVKWRNLWANKMKAHFSRSRPRANAKLYDEILRVDQDKAKRLSSREVDGHRAIGFKIKEDPKGIVLIKTIWVNEKAKFPVRIEQVFKSQQGAVLVQQILTNFAYDQPLDGSLFSMTIPEGYEVTTDDEIPKSNDWRPNVVD